MRAHKRKKKKSSKGTGGGRKERQASEEAEEEKADEASGGGAEADGSQRWKRKVVRLRGEEPYVYKSCRCSLGGTGRLDQG